MKLDTKQTKETPTRISLQDLLARAAEIKDRKPKQVELYIESLGANIVIEEPSRDLCLDAMDMVDGGDAYLVANVVISPKINNDELRAAFDAVTPIDLAEKLFKPGELSFIGAEALKLAGYGKDSVKMVDEIKN